MHLRRSGTVCLGVEKNQVGGRRISNTDTIRFLGHHQDRSVAVLKLLRFLQVGWASLHRNLVKKC
jgi:hypothetical protein